MDEIVIYEEEYIDNAKKYKVILERRLWDKEFFKGLGFVHNFKE